MRLGPAISAILIVFLACIGAVRAGLEAGSTNTPALEVLVFEHPDCTYCQVFRRDILPKYRESGRATSAPLRFVDISTSDTKSIGLNTRLEVLPTAVVMRDGREVDRIVGYWGPTNFFKLLSHILTRME